MPFFDYETALYRDRDHLSIVEGIASDWSGAIVVLGEGRVLAPAIGVARGKPNAPATS